MTDAKSNTSARDGEDCLADFFYQSHILGIVSMLPKADKNKRCLLKFLSQHKIISFMQGLPGKCKLIDT